MAIIRAEIDRLTRERDEAREQWRKEGEMRESIAADLLRVIGRAERAEEALEALRAERSKERIGFAQQYLTLTDAMGYDGGEAMLSPEGYAAELAKDAARYRWLRDKANFARKHDPMVCLHPLDEQELICGPELDAAMDAALAQIEQERSEQAKEG